MTRQRRSRSGFGSGRSPVPPEVSSRCLQPAICPRSISMKRRRADRCRAHEGRYRTLRRSARAAGDPGLYRSRQAVADCKSGPRSVPGEDHHVAQIHPEYADIGAPQQDYDRARELLAEAGYRGRARDHRSTAVAQPTWEPNTCEGAGRDVASCRHRSRRQHSCRAAPIGTAGRPRLSASPAGRTVRSATQSLSLAYRTGVPWNESSYSNAEFDALLDEAEATFDVDARREVMAQLQEILQDDAVIVQPFWRSIHTAGSPRVKGHTHHPAEEHRFRNGVARSLMRISQEARVLPPLRGDIKGGVTRVQSLQRQSMRRAFLSTLNPSPPGEGGRAPRFMKAAPGQQYPSRKSRPC